MKKSLTAIAVLLAIVLSSCSGVNDDPAHTSGSSEITESTAATTEMTTESTPETSADDTATTETESTDDTPKFNISDESDIPFRLLTMTYGQIEAEFGPMKQLYLFGGGAPVYTAEKLSGVEIMFTRTSQMGSNGRPEAAYGDIPNNIRVSGDNAVIHPEISDRDISSVIPEVDPRNGVASYSEMGFYSTAYNTADHSVVIYWSFPNDTFSALVKNMQNGKSANAYWQNNEFNGSISSFVIYRPQS